MIRDIGIVRQSRLVLAILMRALKLQQKLEGKLNLLKRYAQSFDEAGTYPDYDDN